MTRLFPVLTTALILAGGSLTFAQDPTPADRGSATENTKARAKDAVSNEAVNFGTVKEHIAGKKVVIAIDNKPDKSFDLADKDVKITLADTVKVGDTVKVAEHSVMGKTKMATISKATAAEAAAAKN